MGKIIIIIQIRFFNFVFGVSENVSRQSRKFRGLSQKFHGLSEKFHGLSEMFHGRPPFLPFSWQASPCVAERPGVTFGATTGAT